MGFNSGFKGLIYIYHEIQIHNEMGMNHFKNSVNTCFVHNDTLDLLRNLQQVSYSARLGSIALFPIHFPSLYGSKAEFRTVYLDMAVPRK